MAGYPQERVGRLTLLCCALPAFDKARHPLIKDQFAYELWADVPLLPETYDIEDAKRKGIFPS